MEHPNKEKLEKYASRELSAGEMTVVILHLADCPDCFDYLHRLSFSAENEPIALFSELETEVFHLNYDEHLRPFVDLEADGATREIVESHTQICSNCAFELRELREFAESLRLRQIENSAKTAGFFGKINELLHNLSHLLTLTTVLPLVLITIVAAGAVIWLSAHSTENNSGKTSITEEQKSVDRNEHLQINPDENSAIIAEQVNQNVAERKLPDQKPPQPEKIQPPENTVLAEVNTLPENLRVSAQKTLQTRKLVFPAFLAAIREDINFRGTASGNSNSIYPKNEAVRDVAPQFRWTRFAAEGEKYVVEIFDGNNNSIAVSPALNVPNWKPKIALQRGKTYSWEVRTEKTNAPKQKSFAGKFRVLESIEIAKINKNLSKSALLRGIVFASSGLLTEAESEFNKAIKSRENAELARELLVQIRNQK